jgi:CRP-like cAMP-binding protein
MGCGMFLDIQESMSTLVTRENKKTQKIDCRRKSSQAQNTIYEHINIIGEITDEDNINFVCTHLKEHSLFCTLEKQELREVARSMKLATALKDSYILNEGDKGSCFFLIKNGEVDVEISANYIRTIGAGQCFG